MRYAMIMAGGAGTRLWPMSRAARPKQLLPFIDGRSLLELAAERLDGVVPQASRFICTGEAHRQAIRAALPDFDDEHILGEPTGRDTLNAVGLTAAVLAHRDADAVFCVLTSDHLIEPVDVMRENLRTGLEVVEQDHSRFLTYSIKSTFAAEQYGWVTRGKAIDADRQVYRAEQFKEKPGAVEAERFHADPNINWNSGMFVFPAAGFMDAVKWFRPDAYDGLMRIGQAWDTPQRQAVLAEVYPKLPKVSVDHGVMNPAGDDDRIEICTINLDVRWLDVGSWTSYAETLKGDADGVRANTRSVNIESHDITVVSDDPNHTVATVGCRDLIIVHTADATLVCSWDEAQKVKQLADQVDASLR